MFSNKQTCYRNNYRCKGVTLIELSFVVIFLALTFAIISFGKNLQTSSRIQSIIQESEKYLAATLVFYDNYSYIPGDYPNAFTVFSNCGTIAAECNGNGDTLLDEGTQGNDSEVLRFWQHLNLAGLIDGYYTGESSGSPPSATIGDNCPKSKSLYGNGGYGVSNVNYFSTVQDNTIFSRLGGYNVLILGVPSSSSDLKFLNSIITPAIARNIDKKTDDGLPEYGKVMAFDGENNPLLSSYISDTCLNGSEGSATYNETNRTDSCHLIWEISIF